MSKSKTFLGVLCVLFLAFGLSGCSTSQSDNTTGEVIQTSQVESIDIQVSSQIVKKVGSKYRYFFDIRNMSENGFEGDVTIKLYNDKQQSPLGSETFSTNSAIEPSLGTSVNFDINTGPVSEHGEYGITKFSYVVEVSGDEVNSGEGTISENFEDLSN